MILVASCRTVVQDKWHGVLVTFRHRAQARRDCCRRRTRVGRGRKKLPRGFYLTAEVDNDDTFVALAEWANEGGRLLLAMSQRYGRSVPLSLSLSLEGTKVTHGFLLGDSQPADRASTQSVSIPSKYIFKSSWGSLSCTLD